MLVEEEVRGLDVAVHQAARVRVLERAGDLTTDVRGLRRAQARAGVEHGAQAAAGEQFEHHERDVVLAPVVHRHHVRVVEAGGDLGLGPEAAQEAGVLGEGEVQHLDRDAAAQPHVVGHVHPTGRARADRGEQAIATGEDAAGEVTDTTARHRATVPAARGGIVALAGYRGA